MLVVLLQSKKLKVHFEMHSHLIKCTKIESPLCISQSFDPLQKGSSLYVTHSDLILCKMLQCSVCNSL